MHVSKAWEEERGMEQNYTQGNNGWKYSKFYLLKNTLVYTSKKLHELQIGWMQREPHPNSSNCWKPKINCWNQQEENNLLQVMEPQIIWQLIFHQKQGRPGAMKEKIRKRHISFYCETEKIPENTVENGLHKKQKCSSQERKNYLRKLMLRENMQKIWISSVKRSYLKTYLFH